MTFDPVASLYLATPKQLDLGRDLEKLVRTCPLEQVPKEAGVIAETRAAWVEAVNVARAHGAEAEEREAVGIVACLTGPLEIARARLG